MLVTCVSLTCSRTRARATRSTCAMILLHGCIIEFIIIVCVARAQVRAHVMRTSVMLAYHSNSWVGYFTTIFPCDVLARSRACDTECI